jgi:hypothetical protein
VVGDKAFLYTSLGVARAVLTCMIVTVTLTVTGTGIKDSYEGRKGESIRILCDLLMLKWRGEGGSVGGSGKEDVL